jgi:hypothetical protein
MMPTTYPQINVLLDSLLSQMQGVLGEKLVGLYLYGSLVTGDFDQGISDLDLTTALTSDADDVEFDALKGIHVDFVTHHPEWDDRIEVCYVSVDALATVTSQQCPLVNISPGEPFHRTRSRPEWLLSWYFIREESVSLYGPAARTLIEPISKGAMLEAVKGKSRALREWMRYERRRGAQAYAILTLCRCLYTCRYGKQISKRQAALWTANELPEWFTLIQDAVSWRQARREAGQNGEATYDVTWVFVDLMVKLIAAE